MTTSELITLLSAYPPDTLVGATATDSGGYDVCEGLVTGVDLRADGLEYNGRTEPLGSWTPTVFDRTPPVLYICAMDVDDMMQSKET